ncbi:hypothetical protein [Psychrobacter fjordensis]|uniref:hypothetical protein n=1 Tax=Psychrobacter fjordensis TaxID=664424 RepID=UPI00191ABC55|nr:hypothetical protein [Psychrobacter fjordensis]
MNVEDIASGQKIVIYSIVANFLVGVSQRSTPELGVIVIVFSLLVTAAAIYGAYRLCTGLDYSVGIKVLVVVLLFVPFINLITLIVLSVKGTKVLRQAGYEVGFFGVK